MTVVLAVTWVARAGEADVRQLVLEEALQLLGTRQRTTLIPLV